LEERVVSIFRAEEKSKQEASNKKAVSGAAILFIYFESVD
jgi:hypothetical protein